MYEEELVIGFGNTVKVIFVDVDDVVGKISYSNQTVKLCTWIAFSTKANLVE